MCGILHVCLCVTYKRVCESVMHGFVLRVAQMYTCARVCVCTASRNPPCCHVHCADTVFVFEEGGGSGGQLMVPLLLFPVACRAGLRL